MDFLRKKNEVELGLNPISIGVWLGGDNTPNKRSEARSNVSNFRRNKRNLMLVTKCPWCNGELGHIFDEKKRYKGNYGYERNREGSIDFKCQDSACDFYLKPLPILIVDEDIYEKNPSLLIGVLGCMAQNLKNEVFLDTSQFLNLNLINYEKHEIHIGRYGGSLTLGSWM